MPIPSTMPPLPANVPQPNTQWTHWKGHTVTVLGTGRHSETLEPVVCYTHATSSGLDVWVRPLAMWDDEARPGIQRFTLVPN